jgi:hypothetical protein
MKKTIAFCLYAFVLLLVITGILLTRFIFVYDYNGFIEHLTQNLGKQDNWIPYFKTRLPIHSFSFIKKMVCVYDIVTVPIIVLLIYHSKKIITNGEKFLNKIYTSVKQILVSFKTLSTFEKYFFYTIIAFVFIKAVWYAFTLPIQYDEAWSYNYYESNSFWESFLLPGNNHKFFTVIAWFFNRLPFFNKVFLIRLPAAIGGVLLLTLFFNYVKKSFSTGIALIGFTWLAICAPVAIYMIIARSYIYVLLFSLLLIEVCFRIINNNTGKYHYAILFCIIILGYFTNPVFFFGHFILTLFIIFQLFQGRQYKTIKAVIYTNIIATVCLIVIYAADILGGHFHELASAAFKPEGSNYFITCLKYNGWYQLGWGIEPSKALFIFLPILTIAFILCFVKKVQPKKILLYAIVSIVWLPIYALLAHDDTSCRKTIYITLSFTFLLMFILDTAFHKYIHNKYLVAGICIIILLANSISLPNFNLFKWSTGMNESCEKISSILLSKNISSCYIFQNYYKPGMEFYCKENSRPIKLYMADSTSIDYSATAFTNATAESVLLDKEINTSIDKTKYYLLFEDQYVALYALKK